MKALIIALMSLPLMSAAALAGAAENDAPRAAAEVEASADSNTVGRAEARPATLGLAELAPAGVADVDANGDGKISFEELLRHDLKSDF